MPRKLDDVIAALPKARQKRVQARALELATLKDLRLAAQQTQEQLAATLGVGQDTISRLEKRSDMLLSTLRHDLNTSSRHRLRPLILLPCLRVKRSQSRHLDGAVALRTTLEPFVERVLLAIECGPIVIIHQRLRFGEQ